MPTIRAHALLGFGLRLRLLILVLKPLGQGFRQLRVGVLQHAVAGVGWEPYVVSGPMDLPSNYGGKYWDVGFGLNAFVLTGDLQGNSLSFEWLQPVSDNVNGYQLERNGALSANWSYAF